MNAKLPALVAGKTQAGSPIDLVNQYTGFDPATMTYDGTHPNDTGNSRMADRWFEHWRRCLMRSDTDCSNGQTAR